MFARASTTAISIKASAASIARRRSSDIFMLQGNFGGTVSSQFRKLHPEKRLQQARRRALEAIQAEMMAQQPQSAEEPAGHELTNHVNEGENSAPSTQTNPKKIKSRLEVAREAARSRIEHFEPIRPKPRPIQIKEVSLFERPPPKRNDGVSSGALAEQRLREKRREALERIAELQAAQRREGREQ